MNDFTKDELWSLIALINDTNPDSIKWNHPVYIKLQSLIENHPKCDHRSGMWFYNEAGERVKYDTGIYRCRHCDILFKFLCENGVCIATQDLE